ncbi:hemerythrin domain-containing protein [Variovorax ureilyticus]|uniref:Hemerythrin domain-containing protein n=1 Tax=Variovorax ureilyticus TaxID=1836198 RepID=A0ABU8VG50_9BURK
MSAFDNALNHEIAPLLAHLSERLRRGPLDARSQQMLHRLREVFLPALAAHDEWLSTQLFPALYESMAGSDAVCIRDMESGLRSDHRSLAAQWHALAPLLCSDALPSTHAQTLLPRIEALTALCARLAEFERDELFPMAERLLSDDVLARLLA